MTEEKPVKQYPTGERGTVSIRSTSGITKEVVGRLVNNPARAPEDLKEQFLRSKDSKPSIVSR